MVDEWIARKEYSKLVELWVDGLEVDWNRCYGDAKPPRIQLPTYPFAKDEYWLDSAMSRPPRCDMGSDMGSDMTIQRTSAAPGSLRIIEDIISKIDDDTIDAAHGVRLLKQLI